MKMSLNKGVLMTIVIALIVIGVTMLIPIYQYYQPAEAQLIYRIPAKHSDDTLRVLFIGDSWAAYHQAHDSILATMISSSTNKPCVVKSIGNVGAKSKEVYERLFSSTKPFILEHPDYCIISVGINDAVAKMGADYYTSNYVNILDFLISQKIVSIVLDMPNVDYSAVYNRESFSAKFRHQLSSAITRGDFYSFSSYRIALSETLNKLEKHDSIIYVEAQNWMPNNSAISFYCDDGIHLNAEGYQKLDSCLSIKIANNFSFSHGNLKTGHKL